jgi:hypothetical protein
LGTTSAARTKLDEAFHRRSRFCFWGAVLLRRFTRRTPVLADPALVEV